MFKPHYGYCKFCEKDDQLIVVSKGYCQKCNHDQKQAKKKASSKRTGKPAYVSQANGEGEMMREMALNALGDEATRCFVCGIPIAALTYSNFAHVLSKKQYTAFRTYRPNLKILCHKIVADDNNPGCHTRWDQRPRSEIINDPKWSKMFELEEQLKEEYKNLTNL